MGWQKLTTEYRKCVVHIIPEKHVMFSSSIASLLWWLIFGDQTDLSKTRWWFQLFFIFTPNLGEDYPIWRAYFLKGLVQPPTRKGSTAFFLVDSADFHLWVGKVASYQATLGCGAVSGGKPPAEFGDVFCEIRGDGEIRAILKGPKTVGGLLEFSRKSTQFLDPLEDFFKKCIWKFNWTFPIFYMYLGYWKMGDLVGIFSQAEWW